MALKLKNAWDYKGTEQTERWDWTAFVDDKGTGELAEVEYVEYVLHPTFAKSVVRVTNPEGGFALRTNGWGVFTLTAFVTKKNGARVKLVHELELAHEPPVGVSA